MGVLLVPFLYEYKSDIRLLRKLISHFADQQATMIVQVQKQGN